MIKYQLIDTNCKFHQVKGQQGNNVITFKIYSAEIASKKIRKILVCGLFLHSYLLFSWFTQMFQKDTLVKCFLLIT